LILLACSALWDVGKAQNPLPAASQSEDSLTAQTLFELALVRVQQLMPAYWTAGDTAVADQEVRALLKEALQLAAQKEWSAAEALLSVVADYSAAQSRPSTSAAYVDDSPDQRKEHTRWHPEVFAGVEGWQQRFALPGELQDTTLVERSGNPILGLRLAVEHGPSKGRLLDGALELRSSRDYQAGRLAAGYRVRFAGGHYLALQNELEGSVFREALTPGYVRDNLRCEMAYVLVPELITTLGYTGSCQHYRSEEQFYASFVSHRLNGELTALATLGTRLSVGYTYERCRYPSWPTRDYQDHWLRCRLFHRGVLLEGNARYRSFLSAFVDSLYNNDYLEGQLRADWRGELLPWLGLVLRAELMVRDYRYSSSSSVDYRIEELAPGVRFTIPGLGVLELSYQLQQRTPFRTASLLDDQFAGIDQYLAQGPAITVESSGLGGLLFSVHAATGTVVHPAGTVRDASGLSFFYDRRASSLMCFLTWPVSMHWELNVFANYDADLDAQEVYDSRSSLLTFEVRYRF